MPVTAVLLAAGYATRLYPLTKDRPKTLLPLDGGTILDAVVDRLGPEVAKRVLVTNHRFAAQFHQWRVQRGLDVEIVDDGTDTPATRLGAIGDLELVRTHGCEHDDLLVVGTDNLFKWPLADFVRQAQRHAPAPSIGLWEAPSAVSAVQFGVVTLDEAGRVTAFVEKSPQPPSRMVSLCLYYFPAAMAVAIPQFLQERPKADAPGYFIAWLVGRGPVYGVVMRGLWYDIGTRQAYDEARDAWKTSGGRSTTRRNQRINRRT